MSGTASASERDVLQPADVLGDVLALYRVRAALLATFDAHAPWAIELPARRGASFHAVVAGTCWFAAEGSEPRALAPGDVVLLPTGIRHELTAEPPSPGRVPERFDEDLKQRLITPQGELVLRGPGARTRILCAGYDYDSEVAHPLLDLLPSVLHVSTAQPDTGPWLRTVLDLLAHEASGAGRAGTGSGVAAVGLLEVLLVHVVRAWLDGTTGSRPAEGRDGVTSPSWLHGLRDPVVARALSLLHADPGRNWTLHDLAAGVHVSRATLARRFALGVGEPPQAYLTRWRMELAARLLRETTMAVAAVAGEVGYSSEFAFNRAFTRLRGCPPGRYRREASPPSARGGAAPGTRMHDPRRGTSMSYVPAR